MLYQLSYASALKPTKNSRWFRESASSGRQKYEHASSQHCGKGRVRSLSGNPHCAENATFSTVDDLLTVENSPSNQPARNFFALTASDWMQMWASRFILTSFRAIEGK
jgi:hypothetical protein